MSKLRRPIGVVSLLLAERSQGWCYRLPDRRSTVHLDDTARRKDECRIERAYFPHIRVSFSLDFWGEASQRP